MNIFKRKPKPKWLVKNTHTLKYAGKEGGWFISKENAKRFDNFEDARFISQILLFSVSVFSFCEAVKEND